MNNTVVFAQREKIDEKRLDRVKNAYLNIYCIENGECEILLGKRKIKAGKNCVAVVRSDISFNVRFEENTTYMYAALRIKEDEKKKNRLEVVFDGDFRTIYDAVSLAVKKFEFGAFSGESDFEGLALEIVADLEVEQIRVGDLTEDIIGVLRKKAWDENFCLEEYMRSLPYAYDYLRRAFQKETGKTPLAYLTDLRLDFAAAKLRSGKTEIKELSSRVGIKDSLYFSRLFKKKFGLSPLEYAKKYEEQS